MWLPKSCRHVSVDELSSSVLRAVFDSCQDCACMQQLFMMSLQLLYQTPSCWIAKCQTSDCCVSYAVADFGLVAPGGSCAISILGHLSLLYVCAHTFSAGSQVAPRYFSTVVFDDTHPACARIVQKIVIDESSKFRVCLGSRRHARTPVLSQQFLYVSVFQSSICMFSA